jgi:DNA-binding GntR family transcriptional regulator
VAGTGGSGGGHIARIINTHQITLRESLQNLSTEGVLRRSPGVVYMVAFQTQHTSAMELLPLPV